MKPHENKIKPDYFAFEKTYKVETCKVHIRLSSGHVIWVYSLDHVTSHPTSPVRFD